MKPTASILWTALTCCLVLAACTVGPLDTVEQYYRGLERGQLEETLALMEIGDTVQGEEREELKAAFMNESRGIRDKGGFAEVNIVKKELWDDFGEVSVALIYGDGTVETETVSLIKKDGKWKIRFAK